MTDRSELSFARQNIVFELEDARHALQKASLGCKEIGEPRLAEHLGAVLLAITNIHERVVS